MVLDVESCYPSICKNLYAKVIYGWSNVAIFMNTFLFM